MQIYKKNLFYDNSQYYFVPLQIERKQRINT